LDQIDCTVRHPGRRGDLLLARTEGTQVPDVSITHPAASRRLLALARRGQHARPALQRWDAHKCWWCAADSDGLPYVFLPLTCETFGRLGGSAVDNVVNLSALADFAVSIA
jgi:hypothetical protein